MDTANTGEAARQDDLYSHPYEIAPTKGFSQKRFQELLPTVRSGAACLSFRSA